MASDPLPTRSAETRHRLPLPALRRARLHAELAGMDAVHAARAVTHAQRRCTGASGDEERFWRALYIELAPLGEVSPTSDPIANALAAIPLEARTAILLRLGESMAPDAIARALDEPPARAAAHLAIAVSRLRDVLGDAREDAIWLAELRTWLHAHEPASARIERPAAKSLSTPPTPPATPAWTSSTPLETKPRRSTTRWVGAALILVLTVMAGFGAQRWHAARPAPVPADAPDPVATLLALSASDAALIGGQLELALLAELDFHLWLRRRDPSLNESPVADDSSASTAAVAVSLGLGPSTEAWAALPVSEQTRRLQRLQQWQTLTLAQRAALRLNLPYWEVLTDADRHALSRQRESYLALPTAERERLQAEFDGLSPVARRALLPSRADAAGQALTRELFAFIPLEEQSATLAMLAALDESSLGELRQLTRRLPPWQREELRLELLAQPAGDRSAWLSARAAGRPLPSREPATQPQPRQP